MNTPAIRSRDIDTFDRYEALARLTALDRAYGMVEFDLDGRMVSVNPLFCDMLGYPPEALVGQSHLMLLPPDLQAEHDLFWQKVLGGEIQSGEFRRVRQGGSPRGGHCDCVSGVVSPPIAFSRAISGFACGPMRSQAPGSSSSRKAGP